MRNSPVTRSAWDVVQKAIQELRRDVQLLKNEHSPTVPIYLPDIPDDQIDGQIALVPVAETLEGTPTTVKPSWSFGGVWRALGIMFGVVNSGSWLDVETDDVGPSSWGMYFRAVVGSGATPGIVLSSDGIVELDSNHVILGEDLEVDITPTVVSVGNNQANYPRRIDMQLANLTTTPQGSKFVVYDSNGDSIFEVRDDGTFHIKTGGTLVADL